MYLSLLSGENFLLSSFLSLTYWRSRFAEDFKSEKSESPVHDFVSS